MLLSLCLISLGASAGAISRWLLGNGLNHWLPDMPLGTLVANLTGGYLAGMALAIFTHWPDLPAEWRLLIITGFLGGLTTFSTFSVEVAMMLQQGRLLWVVTMIGAHVLGSVVMTLLGIVTVTWSVRHL